MGNEAFAITQADVIAAYRAWWTGSARWQTFLKAVAGVGLAYLALAVAATWREPWPTKLTAAAGAIGVAIALVILLFAVGYAMIPRRARRSLRENKTLAERFSWEWNEDGFTIVHPRSTTKLPWSMLYGWLVGPQTLLLLQSSMLFYPIPRHTLAPGELEQVVGHLRAAGVAERKRFGCLAWKPAS